MAKDYQVDETKTELRFYVPPPNKTIAVAIATLLVSLSLWFAGFTFYLSLARSEDRWGFVYIIACNSLALICFISLKVLFHQLAAKEIVFERHVIEVSHRILGVRVRQQWFSAASIQEWITVQNSNGKDVFLAIRYRDRTISLVETLDYGLWISLVVRMQCKEFTYV